MNPNDEKKKSVNSDIAVDIASDSETMATPTEPEVDELQALKDQVIELEDLRLRMAAENQNTRKRLVKQQQDAFTYRHQDILRDLADVVDNLERAIESSADSRDFATFYEGIKMIENQFSGMLTEKYNLERVGEDGETFDPVAHEAVMVEESPDVDEDKVKQVFQAGYRLHDRILRPAKVVVVKPGGTKNENNVEENITNEKGAE